MQEAERKMTTKKRGGGGEGEVGRKLVGVRKLKN